MKKLITSALVLLIAFTSCKKDEETEISATGGNATVTAGLYGFDGNNAGKFSSTKAGITQVTAAGITTFSITAIKDNSNESITIILLKKITATGKISFGSALANGAMVISKDYTKPADLSLNYSSDRNSRLMTGGGEVNITKLDGDKVEGHFMASVSTMQKKNLSLNKGLFQAASNS